MEIRRRVADTDHLTRRDIQILLCVDTVGRVDQAAAFDMQFHRSSYSLLPATMPITAMRTAMPNVT
jgi:hypothetical protein